MNPNKLKYGAWIIAMIGVVVVIGAGPGGGRTPAAIGGGPGFYFPPAASPAPEGTSILSSDDASLSRHEGRLFYQGELFSGIVTTKNSLGDVTSVPYKTGVKDGRKYALYADGSLKHGRTWRQGKREGDFLSYWSDGQIKQAHFYKDDLLEGQLEEWFDTGQKSRSFTYENGKEEGSQKMWYEDGTIRANYVVRDGRRFGSIGTKGCVSESNE